MKKRGFTLVELLAVIAILAILVIMALPAVLRMYRQSRINSFQNEVRGVYKTAQQRFLEDSMLLDSGSMIAYTNVCSSVTGVSTVKQLDMTGNSNFKYYVLINVDGEILNVRASNGTYSYALQSVNVYDEIKIEDIDVEMNNQETLDNNIENSLCPSSEENQYNHVVRFLNRKNKDSVTIGDEVAIGNEPFLVLSTNSSKTELFAKYNLLVGDAFDYNKNNDIQYSLIKTFSASDKGYGLQNSFARGYLSGNIAQFVGTVPYSGKKYWNNDVGEGKTYSGDYCTVSTETGCAYVYNSELSTIEPSITYENGYGESESNDYTIAYYVENYVNELKNISKNNNITGRLMKLEEAYSISQQTDTVLKNNLYNGSFWVGTAYSTSGIWVVNSTGTLANYRYKNGYYRGVRPIIIVNTSEL